MNENMNESMLDNKLSLNLEDGSTAVINVLDILESLEFNKTFIIYYIEGRDDTIFASILNEKEESFSLDTITDENEINYIQEQIDAIIEEMDDQEV